VTWLRKLVVLHVLCMFIWPWPDQRSKSRGSRFLKIFAKCRYYTNFKWPHFCTAGCYGDMVRHAGSPICIAHTDVTLTWSKAKVKSLTWISENCNFLRLPPPLFWRGAHNWWVITIVWDLVYSYSDFQSQISEFLPQLVVTWLRSLQNVNITKIHCVLSQRWQRLEACDYDCM